MKKNLQIIEKNSLGGFVLQVSRSMAQTILKFNFQFRTRKFSNSVPESNSKLWNQFRTRTNSVLQIFPFRPGTELVGVRNWKRVRNWIRVRNWFRVRNWIHSFWLLSQIQLWTDVGMSATFIPKNRFVTEKAFLVDKSTNNTHFRTHFSDDCGNFFEE